METLKSLREASGFKAKETAETLGISRSTYSNYEQGTRCMDIRYIIPLAKLYRVTAEEIIKAQLCSIEICASKKEIC